MLLGLNETQRIVLTSAKILNELLAENDHSSVDRMNLSGFRDWKPTRVLHKAIYSFMAMITID